MAIGRLLNVPVGAGLALAIAGIAAMLLAGPARAQDAKDPWGDAFPKEWHFHNKGPAAIAGRQAAELRVGPWHNDGGKPLAELRGKPVVIDFWGTWCGPCKAAAPHFTELAEKYEGKAHFMAVCNTRGSEKMAEVARQVGMRVPTAADQGDQTARAYGVSLWPYYVFIDSKGVVRAAGIRTDKVEDALKKLIEVEAALGRSGGDAPAGDGGEAEGGTFKVKAEWLEDGDRPIKRRRLEPIERAAAPALDVTDWINSDPLTLQGLKGKIVVLDFWGTWCDECRESVSKNNALYEKYKGDGVVLIGVCHPRQADKMKEVAAEQGIAFPIAADATGATNRAYRANDTPDYYMIDPSGKVVVADADDAKVEEIIKAMVEAYKPRDDAGAEAPEREAGEGEATPARRVRPGGR